MAKIAIFAVNLDFREYFTVPSRRYGMISVYGFRYSVDFSTFKIVSCRFRKGVVVFTFLEISSHVAIATFTMANTYQMP